MTAPDSHGPAAPVDPHVLRADASYLRMSFGCSEEEHLIADHLDAAADTISALRTELEEARRLNADILARRLELVFEAEVARAEAWRDAWMRPFGHPKGLRGWIARRRRGAGV